MLSYYRCEKQAKPKETIPKEDIAMNKNAFHTVKLAKGEMNVYDFSGIRLHAYKTNDLIDDEVFIIEKTAQP